MFPDQSIWNACVAKLTWTHFRALLRVKDNDARFWYMKEVANEGWSSRVLDRNIGIEGVSAYAKHTLSPISEFD